MKHLDLFSGIGGFALATEMVWDNVEHIFCEIDPFCEKILKKHWPQSPQFKDIRELTTDAFSKNVRGEPGHMAQTQRKEPSQPEVSWECWLPSGSGSTGVDLLTGGFPCQPFSQAGRRKGKDDDRFLWPEMLRVIKEFKPRWIIGENVAGILSMAQQQSNPDVESEADIENDNNGDEDAGGIIWDIINDIEQAGYAVQTFVIPAVAVNAPHRRDRVWIVGYNDSYGRAGRDSEVNTTEARKPTLDNLTRRLADGADAPDSTSAGGQHGRSGEQRNGTQRQEKLSGRDSWEENWLEVATRLCTLDDGLPEGLARPKGWRNAALKGAGNAIVPQVAAEIMRAIKATETL